MNPIKDQASEELVDSTLNDSPMRPSDGRLVKDDLSVERFWVGEVAVSRLNLPLSVDFLSKALKRGRLGYVCVINVRAAHQANRDSSFACIQNQSLLTVPDGMPLIWYARRKGFPEVSRVCGPDLMRAILGGSLGSGHSHYFYGSRPEVLGAIANRLAVDFSGVRILGMQSPPIQEVDDFRIEELADEINRLAPSFLWIGLGAPKQEEIMARLQPLLSSTICVGVGLAFEYFSGHVQRPPLWIQRNGLEWTWRLAQQPGKIGRFVRPFCWFIKEWMKIPRRKVVK